MQAVCGWQADWSADHQYSLIWDSHDEITSRPRHPINKEALSRQYKAQTWSMPQICLAVPSFLHNPPNLSEFNLLLMVAQAKTALTDILMFEIKFTVTVHDLLWDNHVNLWFPVCCSSPHIHACFNERLHKHILKDIYFSLVTSFDATDSKKDNQKIGQWNSASGYHNSDLLCLPVK